MKTRDLTLRASHLANHALGREEELRQLLEGKLGVSFYTTIACFHDKAHYIQTDAEGTEARRKQGSDFMFAKASECPPGGQQVQDKYAGQHGYGGPIGQFFDKGVGVGQPYSKGITEQRGEAKREKQTFVGHKK